MLCSCSAALPSGLPGCQVEEQICSLADYSWHTPLASAPRKGCESSSPVLKPSGLRSTGDASESSFKEISLSQINGAV